MSAAHADTFRDHATSEPPVRSRRPVVHYVFRVESDGRASFPHVSQACAELYGFPAERAEADVDLMHDAIHPDDRRGHDAASERSLHSLEPLHWAGRVVRQDGSERTVTVASMPRRMPGGATEWSGAVTEQEPAPASEGDALAIFGHDAAGPLTAIMLAAELGLEDLDRPGDAGQVLRRRLHTVLRQARRLDELREDVLTLAAADAGVVEAHPVDVEVAPFLQAAVDVVVPPGVVLDVHVPPGLRCRVQPGHLRQMLFNLISNAAKHAVSSVTLTAAEAGERVLLTVRDDGPGVAPDVTPRLFRRFAHAGADRLPSGAGSGLGLYIVHTLAQANGGSVLYWPGEPGARFTLALPAAGAV